MLTAVEVDQLIADVKRMAEELAEISRTDKDATRRLQAKRWWNTLARTIEYAGQVRDMYRKS